MLYFSMCCDCENLEKEKSSLEQDNKRLEQEIKLLKEMLKLERLRKFGSKSEQSNPNQLEFDSLLAESDELNAA